MTKYLIDENGNITIEEPTRLPGEIWLEVVLITHDESTFYSNECKSVVWMENGYANQLLFYSNALYSSKLTTSI